MTGRRGARRPDDEDPQDPAGQDPAGEPGSDRGPVDPQEDAADLGPSDPEFDEAAFDAAFAAAFGEAVEPQRTIRRPDGAPAAGADASDEGVTPDPTAEDVTPDPTAEGVTPDATADGEAPRSVVAVVLTPIASAPALAGLLAFAQLDADIVPTRRGAIAVRVIPRRGEVDPDELLTGAPAPAHELASTLSRTAKAGVVLLTAQIGKGDEGLTGTITGRQYVNGEAGAEVSPGLLLANADDVVEQILFGTLAPADAPGRLVPRQISRWQAGRLFTKHNRRKRP